MTSPAPDLRDLSALGLPPQPTAVLQLVAQEGWTTSVALAAQLGWSRSAVSSAVAALVEVGLVTRTAGRKPAPLRLHPDAALVVAARVSQLEQQRERDDERARRAAAWVTRQAERGATQPAPVHVLDPAGAPPHYRTLSCRTSHWEVVRYDGPTVVHGGSVVRRDAQRRVLVLGLPAPAHLARLRRFGVEVRTTSAGLPVLLVLDGQRARVELSADGRAGRTGWTHDPAQVAALERLFLLWWGESQELPLPA